MTQNNGGPAFPRTVQHFNGTLEGKDGMTLRQYYAIRIFTALTQAHGMKHLHNNAEDAVRATDVLIDALEPKS